MSGETSWNLTVLGANDVDDYVPENEIDGSLPLDVRNKVIHLMKRGCKAYREHSFDEAIRYFSKANTIKSNDPIILRNRCIAYNRFSTYLKSMPPSASEHRPVNGFDPTIYAELALKDAEKLIQLRSDTVDPYLLKATALMLLEKYDMSHDAIISGFQIDPFSTSLRDARQLLETTSIKTRKRNVQRTEYTDDFDCTLCLKLLFEPITTSCGHTFCRSCLFQSVDRGNKCPLCRTVLFITPRTCAVSVTLNNIIQKNFPKEYAERKAEHENLSNFGNDLIPLFVMDVVIPCQKIPLHIFEPRYRLMVRRIMEGNHRMGMVMIDPATGIIADFACEVEIIECEPLQDGRFYIEIESRRRFRILRSWDQDGYRVAEVEWVEDVLPEVPGAKTDLQELTNNVSEYAKSWISRAKEVARHDRRKLEKLLHAEAMMPSSLDPQRFSFWLATLTDWRPHEKLELLRLRDTKERIQRGLVFLRATEQGCRVQ